MELLIRIELITFRLQEVFTYHSHLHKITASYSRQGNCNSEGQLTRILQEAKN